MKCSLLSPCAKSSRIKDLSIDLCTEIFRHNLSFYIYLVQVNSVKQTPPARIVLVLWRKRQIRRSTKADMILKRVCGDLESLRSCSHSLFKIIPDRILKNSLRATTGALGTESYRNTFSLLLVTSIRFSFCPACSSFSHWHPPQDYNRQLELVACSSFLTLNTKDLLTLRS